MGTLRVTMNCFFTALNWSAGKRTVVCVHAKCLFESVAYLCSTRRLHVTTLNETTLA